MYFYRREVKKQLKYMEIAKEELEDAGYENLTFRTINHTHRTTIRYMQIKIAYLTVILPLISWAILSLYSFVHSL